MHLWRTREGIRLNDGQHTQVIQADWDALINHEDLGQFLSGLMREPHDSGPLVMNDPDVDVLPPIGTQEVWAAGVTYFRSRTARMEESKDAGGGTFYDRVYEADRPELFFKASPWRVRGPRAGIRIRKDAKWNVPEPELALCVNARGEIIGYTIGNDVSSRDIEGENPLYLPQAKVYDGSCALGPGLYVSRDLLPPETGIAIRITRGHDIVFEGQTTLAQMRRKPEELVEYLYRETSFPSGCILLTGTGIIPPDAFTLQSADLVEITIEPIGTLSNVVE
ncbi:MAG: 2-hydroxyhepta-2,4-diene-1,7-dioate isomerase [Gemmatimonadetes bacterium]|nr:MAG: 2-hydroxyhepta-2,4-diene-1,7-dioate isomerase [Gemmatimonadota bacterium]